jgi:integrase
MRRTWTADFWYRGRHYRKSLKTKNQKHAVAEATKLAAKLIEGSHTGAIKRYLIEQAVLDFLETVRLNQRAKRTLAQYTRHLNLWSGHLKTLGLKHIDQVLPEHFDSFRRSLTVSRRTVHNYFRSANALMRWAKRYRRIAENPLEEMRVPKPRPPEKPVPSMKQINSILKKARREDLPIFAMAAFTGARIGDIRTRYGEDLDLKLNWIHFRARPGASPKGGKERKVPLHKRLVAILKDYPVRHGTWLFTSEPSKKYPAGDHHINDKHVNERLKKIASELGMKTGRVDGFTFHSLRRFFETHCVNAGIPQKVINRWMGHDSIRETSDYYFTLTDDESQKKMRLLRFPVK